jgi:hypothetical protein
VRELMGDRKPDQPTTTPLAGTGIAPSQPAAVRPTSAAATRPESAAAPADAFATAPPSLSPGIQQVYLPARKGAAAAALDVESREDGPIEVQGRNLLYVPAVLGMGRVHFVDQRRDVNEREDFALLAQAPEGAAGLAWERAQPLTLTMRELMDQSEPDAYFDELPESINQSTEFTALKKDLADHLYRNSSVTLLYSPTLKAYSQPNESERDFRVRLQQTAREGRDADVDEVSERYEKGRGNTDQEGSRRRGAETGDDGLRRGVGGRDVPRTTLHAGSLYSPEQASPDDDGEV